MSFLRPAWTITALLSLLPIPEAIGADYRFIDKMVDSSEFGYSYGYAPSIIYENGVFHMFYCSSGTGPNAWDFIRYVWSSDGRLWSAPQTVLTVSGGASERAACDPSVVYYNAGDRPYYYLFYSGNALDVQTAMFVARSATIGGPYAKWTTAGTWVVNASNPAPIILPRRAVPDAVAASTPWYGAGQQTVVVRNGRLHSWYYDDTTHYPALNSPKWLYTTATHPAVWSAPVETNLTVGSADVKFDTRNSRYVLVDIAADHDGGNTALHRYFSTDGVTWSQPEILAGTGPFIDFTHNVGVSGDNNGNLIGRAMLVVYGAPFDLAAQYSNDCSAPGSPPPHCWGYWDLYGSVVDPAGDTWNGVPWGWTWTGMGSQHQLALGDYDGDGNIDRAIVDRTSNNWYLITSSGVNIFPWGWNWSGMGAQHQLALGDYDGDGKTDRAIVDPNTGNWYVISSLTGGLGVPGIPWGWNWAGMGTHHRLALGDYDGDGKTDRAIVDPNTGNWYVISSLTGGLGVPGIPWGWNWPGMAPHHRLALGDYDGDGKTDRAIVDAGAGNWYLLTSSGASMFPFGWNWSGMGASHRLVLGDYDGDGKTDRAIVDSTGRWFVISSLTGTAGVPGIPWNWSWAGMSSASELALGDYDGDGKTDRAIVDRSSSRWFVLGSNPFRIY